MRNLYVPISANPLLNDAQVINDLHEMGVQRVYITNNGRFCFERGKIREEQLANLKRKRELYESEGFEVGSWICSLGFGDPQRPMNKRIAEKYTRIRSIAGKELDDAICPLDESYTEMMSGLVEDIARSGMKMIMLDDEFCLCVRPGLGCACDLHMAKLREELGEDIGIEELEKKVFTGGASKYRDAWINVMGESMKHFARKIREGVDRVDPSVRVGFCSGYTSWDLEGADALELTEILAGNNKPFLRFTGAPYWISTNRIPRQTLQTIIETVRMQNAWAKGRGIDLFGESDTFPRDRFHSPAVHSEIYDMALMVEGISDFKYVYNYSCQPEYDSYYVDIHKRNKPLYEKIANAFEGKTSVGVRVYEEMRKFRNFDLPEKYTGHKPVMAATMFSDAQAMLTSNAIPTVYEGKGICGIVFGENAKYLSAEDIDGGFILDTKAAEILEARGIDVGLKSVSINTHCGVLMETFKGRYPDDLPFDSAGPRILELKEGADPISFFEIEGYPPEVIKVPSAYRYENAKGQRFLVFAFVGEEQKDSSSFYWSYSRGALIRDNLCWLGKEAPASSIGNPHLYAIAREDGGELAVGYFNIHADEIFNAEITFGDDAENIEFINCEGRQTGARSAVIDYIKPFGFAAVIARKR